MDHSEAPVLDALIAYRRQGQYPFTPPGHKQGPGADPRAVAVLGESVFASDVLATEGLDDRTSSHHVLGRAQDLMADAVRADNAFFSTCGSSLSVKSAMLAVAGPHEKLLVGRDAHKSVVAGLIIAGIRPIWVEPNFDEDLHLAHPPSARAFADRLAEHPDAAGALVTSPTPYGTCADLRAIAEVCHQAGKPLIVDEAWGAHLPFHPDLPSWAMDAGADVCVTSVHKMGAGLEQSSVFHRRASAQLTYADTEESADRLGTALADLSGHRSDLPPAKTVEVPGPPAIRLEQVHLPRDAFFGATEDVSIEAAGGRIAAEVLTPYPPGIPVAVPGERLTRDVLDYLRTGLAAGMVVPDAVDPELGTVRVTSER